MEFKIGDRVKKGSKAGTVSDVSKVDSMIMIKWDNQSTSRRPFRKGTWNDSLKIKIA